MHLKEKWDERARDNAAYWVLTNKRDWTDDDFFAAGQRDIQKYVVPFLGSRDTHTLTALDIGCGLGRLTKALTPLFKHVIGVDISKEMITQAKAKHPELDVRVSEAAPLALPDASIDYVFSFIVFQHFASKEYALRAFKEVYRVLKPGGIAQIQVLGVPFNSFRSPYVWIAFNRFWFGLTKIKGIPFPNAGIFGFRGSLFGPAFKEKEIRTHMSEIGFATVDTWREDHRHLWVYLKK